MRDTDGREDTDAWDERGRGMGGIAGKHVPFQQAMPMCLHISGRLPLMHIYAPDAL